MKEIYQLISDKSHRRMFSVLETQIGLAYFLAILFRKTGTNCASLLDL